ncbi:MAG TPA: hypothetical protein VG148_12205 [Pyrinomonadaceae bacterium]|nr:hypothetical protein [Pyrinomonadaceae bacterium]
MSQVKISSQEAAQMIFPVDTAAIRVELERLLSKPKCADFVKELIKRASENAAPDNTVVAEGDVLKIFDIVLTQKGVVRAGAPGSIPGANFATGSIATNNAGIQIGNFVPGAPVTMEELTALYVKSDGGVAMHETIHHSGRLVYSDQDLAIVVSTMPGDRPPLPTSGNRFEFSRYWDKELRKSFK